MGRVRASALLLAGFAAVAGAQEPRIDSLSPSQGPIAGGTVVTITGAGFSGASVTLDQKPTAPTSISDTQIRLSMPAHDNGYALIQVAAAGHSSAAEYLYVPPKLGDLPPGYITTVAGIGRRYGFDRPATQTNVRPHGLAADAAGNVFIASEWHGRVFRVDPDGLLHTFTGGFDKPDTDGRPAAETYLSGPRSIGFDSAGNAYICGMAIHRIWRIDAASGIVKTIAGTGVAGFSGDGGPARQAMVNEANYLAVAPDGTVYFLDFNNARIRRIATDGIVTTIAGTGVSGSTGDGGPATAAQVEMQPHDIDADAIALDPRGSLYFGETRSGRVRRIDLSSGIITTFVALPDDSADGRRWPEIRSLAVDAAGNVYVGVSTQIFKFAPDGHALGSWGVHKEVAFDPDGTPLTELRFSEALAITTDRDGNILYTDGSLGRVRRLNFQRGRVEAVAGNSPAIFGVPGPAVGALLDGQLSDLAFLPNGDLLFGDVVSQYIYSIHLDGSIAAIAGAGWGNGVSYRNERPVLGAALSVVCIEPDTDGGYFISDGGEISYVDPSGIGHIVTGHGESPIYAGDGGLASEAHLCQPWDVARDASGNLFIADSNNNRIRRIDHETGIITTVVGTGPVNGFEGWGHGTYCGDGGPALQACLNTPMAVAVDPDGNLFVSDFSNQRLRRIDTRGTITTFAQRPTSKLVIDAKGVLFSITDSSTVDRYRPDGRRTVVAGDDGPGGRFSGDGGPATAAAIQTGGTVGVAIDKEGNLFFRDEGNSRIRAVRFGAVLAPSGSQIEATAGTPQSTKVGSRFSDPLEVMVRGVDGVPEPSVRVDFTAPPGPLSCIFSNGRNSISVLTDRAGKAQASCRASCDPGSYEVSATPLGSVTTLRFSLVNTPSSTGRSRCTKQISFRG